MPHTVNASSETPETETSAPVVGAAAAAAAAAAPTGAAAPSEPAWVIGRVYPHEHHFDVEGRHPYEKPSAYLPGVEREKLREIEYSRAQLGRAYLKGAPVFKEHRKAKGPVGQVVAQKLTPEGDLLVALRVDNPQILKKYTGLSLQHTVMDHEFPLGSRIRRGRKLAGEVSLVANPARGRCHIIQTFVPEQPSKKRTNAAVTSEPRPASQFYPHREATVVASNSPPELAHDRPRTSAAAMATPMQTDEPAKQEHVPTPQQHTHPPQQQQTTEQSRLDDEPISPTEADKMVFIMHQKLQKMEAELCAERGAREQLKKTLVQSFAEMLTATGLDPETARKSSEELTPEISGKEAAFHTTFTTVAAAVSTMARNLKAVQRENERYRSGKGHAFADPESRLAPADPADASVARPGKRSHLEPDGYVGDEFSREMPSLHFDPTAGENRAVTQRLSSKETLGSDFVRQSRAELRRLYHGNNS